MKTVDDFCVFILTHGRPDNIITYDTLERGGYTGKIYIVIDDEDETAEQYYQRFGDKVLMFSKQEISTTFDEGDNFTDRRCIIYARNACFDLAKKVGCTYFMQFDDDYTHFSFKLCNGDKLLQRICKNLDAIFQIELDLYKSIPSLLTVAMGQGGDWIGGGGPAGLKQAKKGYKRKAMNSFLCSVDRPFKFYGRLNEDVNFYTCEGRRGALMFSLMGLQLNQKVTQSNDGGMTEIYLSQGTYVKSFYSVMYSPSCVKIGLMGNLSETKRLHHRITWNNCVPNILDERHKKAAA